jgi:hypothetical protein
LPCSYAARSDRLNFLIEDLCCRPQNIPVIIEVAVTVPTTRAAGAWKLKPGNIVRRPGASLWQFLLIGCDRLMRNPSNSLAGLISRQVISSKIELIRIDVLMTSRMLHHITLIITLLLIFFNANLFPAENPERKHIYEYQPDCHQSQLRPDVQQVLALCGQHTQAVDDRRQWQEG